MLAEFAAWWWRHVRESLRAAAGTCGLGDASAPALLIRPDGNGAARLGLRRRGKESDLGSFMLGRASLAALPRRLPPAVLVLPADRMLERDITLPLAAAGDFRRVIEHELDRLTPFVVADVFWQAGILRRDRKQGRAHVRLRLVPLAALAPDLERLAAVGITPVAIEFAESGATVQRFSLAGTDTRADRRRRIRRMALAATAAFALAAVITPFVRQSLIAARLDHEIAVLHTKLAEVAHLRARLAARGRGTGVFAAAEAKSGNVLAALALLTERLPDSAWLTSLTLRRRVATLNGEATAAAPLIPLLAAAPGLKGVSFSAPVTRAESGGDLFDIRALLSP